MVNVFAKIKIPKSLLLKNRFIIRFVSQKKWFNSGHLWFNSGHFMIQFRFLMIQFRLLWFNSGPHWECKIYTFFLLGSKNENNNKKFYITISYYLYNDLRPTKQQKQQKNVAIRFTVVVDNILDYYDVCQHYTNTLRTFKVTNHWLNLSRAYNGYHINALTICNFPYEVQIHTERSQYWRDNEQSRKLYLLSKKALDNESYILYFIIQILLYILSSNVFFQSLLIKFMFNYR